jgi:NAD(P)-dependent dehydrogenase (short-subunit alcohol dehydrogenase family)
LFFDKFKLNNKIALITGGAKGIGLSIAHALGEAGAKLVVIDRENSKGGIEELSKANYDITFFEGDLLDRSVPQKTIDFTLEKHGRVDILVNNAGVAQHGDTEKFNDDLLDKIMDLNVDAVFRMCRSAIPPMKKQGEGVILNIGSISGLVSNIPQPQTAYNASKAAVHMMTKSLASDYADQNIRVNAIAPGYIRTEMTNLPKENEHWYPTWNKLTPMNRMAETHEVASAALFLCSPASSYVTGEVLVVDGGYTTR